MQVVLNQKPYLQQPQLQERQLLKESLKLDPQVEDRKDHHLQPQALECKTLVKISNLPCNGIILNVEEPASQGNLHKNGGVRLLQLIRAVFGFQDSAFLWGVWHRAGKRRRRVVAFFLRSGGFRPEALLPNSDPRAIDLRTRRRIEEPPTTLKGAPRPRNPGKKPQRPT